MRNILLVPIALLLAGCFAGMFEQIEPAYYDISDGSVILRPQVVPADVQSVFKLRLTEVQAPSWLNSTAMQYRLLYAEAERRLSFAESRWVAPPADLLGLELTRGRVVNETRFEADGCQLHVDLNEFIQVFDTPDSSHSLIEVRATILAPRNGKLMAQRIFTQAAPAGPDARSGVAGFGVAVRNLTADVRDWLARLARDSHSLVEICRGESFN